MLDKLPPELILEVCDNISSNDYNDTKTLFNLQQVCQLLRSTIRPLVFKRLKFTIVTDTKHFGPPTTRKSVLSFDICESNVQKFELLTESGALDEQLSNVNTIDILEWSSIIPFVCDNDHNKYTPASAYWNLFTNLLPEKLTNLQCITIDRSMSTFVNASATAAFMNQFNHVNNTNIKKHLKLTIYAYEKVTYPIGDLSILEHLTSLRTYIAEDMSAFSGAITKFPKSLIEASVQHYPRPVSNNSRRKQVTDLKTLFSNCNNLERLNVMNRFPRSLDWVPESVQILELSETTTMSLGEPDEYNFEPVLLPNVKKLKVCMAEPRFQPRIRVPKLQDLTVRVFYTRHATDNITALLQCLSLSDDITELFVSCTTDQILQLITPHVGKYLKSLEIASSVLPARRLTTDQAELLFSRLPRLKNLGIGSNQWDSILGKTALCSNPNLQFFLNHSFRYRQHSKGSILIPDYDQHYTSRVDTSRSIDYNQMMNDIEKALNSW